MLLFYLRKRKHWRELRSDILETIFANAFGNVERLREFVELSEKFKLVENNFLKLQGRGHPPLNSLSSFSLTCLRLAGDLLNLNLPEGSNQQKQSITDAAVAYWSAIVCDPFQFPAYVGLGYLYHAVGLAERAKGMVKMSEEAEEMLLKADEKDISDQNRIAKEEAHLAELRNLRNYLKAEIGLPHEPLQELKEKGICPRCQKEVEPTFHGTCPECGEFLIGLDL
jgi:tetratricopeptide (TPR) repeat protein